MRKIIDRVISDATLSDRKVLCVPVNTIRHTPYNPASRTKEGAKLKRLMESVKLNGIMYPILITDTRDIIDGNRRLAAAKAVGMEFIECIVCGIDRDEAFTTVNTTAEKINGKGWLEIGRGGGYLPAKERAAYEKLHKLLGTYGVDLLIQQNIGLNILDVCERACSFGTTKRIEEVIIKAALNKLTNKINMIIRSDETDSQKTKRLDELLDATN